MIVANIPLHRKQLKALQSMLRRGVSADQEIPQDTLRFDFFAPADSGSIKASWLDIIELCLRQTAGSKTTSTTSSVPGYADQDITLTPCMAAHADSGGMRPCGLTDLRVHQERDTIYNVQPQLEA